MEDLPATAKTHIVPAAQGYAFEVTKGERFRIVDIHGLQIIDFMVWVNKSGLSMFGCLTPGSHCKLTVPILGNISAPTTILLP